MTQESPKAIVQRTFPAPPAKVFDAFLDTGLIGRWMFGPGDEVLHVEVQPQVAGRFSFLIRRDEMEIDHEGEYLAIERPVRLRFTWAATVADEEADASQVEVLVSPAGSGADLTLTHYLHPNWADFVPQAEASWRSMLDRLGVLL